MTDALARLSGALEGRYTIEREVGQGGMATVYLAHDVRHDRKVALKVLRPELSAILGGERFLTEIRTTANLQHPHILGLFDSGDADGLVYYVMPYVEGESVRDRLTREKQLPVDEAVRIAREVADALDYAHQHGVVHRDIKPENILLHGGHAMVADFGIALAASRSEGSTRMTETGMSLGTPHYMAPEQAMGEREITPKADIYALGCVLYEMLTAEPPFQGATAQAIIARVMTEQPRALTLQRHTIPPHVEAAVMTALEKLPADRFASAADLAAALENRGFTTAGSAASVGGAPSRRAGWRGRLRDPVVLGLAVATVTAVVVAAVAWRRPAVTAPVTARYGIPLAVDHGVTGAPVNTLAFAPDGRTIVYVGRSEGGAAYELYERRLDELGAFRAIPGTQGATFPAFSPDGARLGYIRGGRLYVAGVPFSGGAASALAGASAFSTVVWLDNQTLAFNNDSGGIDRVGLDGTVTPLARPTNTPGEHNLWLMGALPGGRTVLVIASPGTNTTGPVVAVDVRDGHRTPVLQSDATAAWYADGFLLWSQPSGTLQAAPFDRRHLRVTGVATTLADSVMQAIGGGGQVAVSAVGSLVYLPEQAPELVLLDRTGRSEVIGQGHRFHSPRFSPDGGRIAFDLIQQGMRDVWTFDLRQRTLTRLSFESDGHDPVWSPDGRWVYFVHGSGSWRRRADGGGVADSVSGSAGTMLEIVRGGAMLSANTPFGSDVGAYDVFVLSADSPRVATPLIASPYNEQAATLSPNGRWLAYASDETGRSEVYVRPYPDGGAKILVSRGGGSEPRWSPDGHALYYRGQSDGRSFIIDAAVAPGPAFTVATRTPLFEASEYEPAEPHANWDISPDGRRFVMVHQGALTAMTVILNWPELVRRSSAERGATP